MEDQLISFETAKLAKQKGFKIKSKLYSQLVTPKGYFHNNLQFGPIPSFGIDEVYSAPTQSLLQKWLREEHDLHIVVENYLDDSKEDVSQIYHATIYSFKFSETDEEDAMDYFPTYEECLENALAEALKYI